jgi:hypothetical protein
VPTWSNSNMPCIIALKKASSFLRHSNLSQCLLLISLKPGDRNHSLQQAPICFSVN